MPASTFPQDDDLLRMKLRLTQRIEPMPFLPVRPAPETDMLVLPPREKGVVWPRLPSDITNIYLLDPQIAQFLSQNSPSTVSGVTRNQITVPIARGSVVTDQVVFEDPRDATKTYVLPRYRLATQLVSGSQEYRMLLEERDGRYRLAVTLEKYAAPELAAEVQTAQELPHDIAVVLRYQIVGSGGAQKELVFNEIAQVSGGLEAVLSVPSIQERDELFRALTTEAYLAQLLVRRAVRVAVLVTSSMIVTRSLRPFTRYVADVATVGGLDQLAQPSRPIDLSNFGIRPPQNVPRIPIDGPVFYFPLVPPLPVPQLVFKGTEDYEANRQFWTRYKLGVSNWAEYSNDLFAVAPDLPPCGANTNAARTWVSIVDENGKSIYGFCALGQARDLDSLWFAVARGSAPPSTVAVTLTDRRHGQSITSPPIELVAPDRYNEVTTALDSTISPFLFSATLHAYIFRNIVPTSNPSAGLVRWQVRWRDVFYSFFQEQARPYIFYYLPDSFKLARRPDQSHAPWLSVRLATADGFQTETSTQVSLSYVAAPFVDPDRLAAAVAELASRVPPSAGQSPRLEPLMTDAVRFVIERPQAVGAVTEERGSAAVALRSMIHDTLIMSLPDFYPLFTAMTEPSATLFRGKVVVQVTGWPAEEIPFTGRIDDMVGDLLAYTSAPDAASGGLHITLTNVVESPLTISALTAVLSSGNSVVAADIRDLTLPIERLAPDEQISFVVVPREPLAGEGELRALLDMDAARLLTDASAVWAAIVDETSSEYYRTVIVKAVPMLFEPVPERPDEQIISIVVTFEHGDTVELTADALEGSARIDLPIEAVIARSPAAEMYSYQLTSIRKNAHQTSTTPPPRRDRMFYVDVEK